MSASCRRYIASVPLRFMPPTQRSVRLQYGSARLRATPATIVHTAGQRRYLQTTSRRHLTQITPNDSISVSGLADVAARTHYCKNASTLLADAAGISRQRVTFYGWLQSSRQFDGFWIGVLRDHTGVVQCVWQQAVTHISNSAEDSVSQSLDYQQISHLPLESCIAVTGTVKQRDAKQIRSDQVNGSVEVIVSTLQVLNMASDDQPIKVEVSNAMQQKQRQRGGKSNADEASRVSGSDEHRLRWRYLDLRRDVMQHNIQLRSAVLQSMRNAMHQNGFTEIETPYLFKSTPEGADEYIVPTRRAGQFYALIQSPQQHKQLLIAAGFHRYYQIARCFRDEGGRADRQPEFTQLDFELSWATSKDVMQSTQAAFTAAVDALQQYVQKHQLPTSRSSPQLLCNTAPVYQSYTDAVSTYGSDKPDTRIPIKLHNIATMLRNSDAMQHLQRSVSKSPADDFLLQASNTCLNEPGQPTVMAFKVSQLQPHLSRKIIDQLIADARNGSHVRLAVVQTPAQVLEEPWKATAWRNILTDSQVTAALMYQLDVQGEDTMIVAAGEWRQVCFALGRARLFCSQLLNSKDSSSSQLQATDVRWQFVTGFPMLEVDATTEHHLAGFTDVHADSIVADVSGSEPVYRLDSIQLKASHHPFTAPRTQSLAGTQHTDASDLQQLLDELVTPQGDRRRDHLTASQLRNLLSIKSASYDLVANGVELGGGSERIHNAQLQRQLLMLLGADPATFQHLLTALASGCPPHAGCALGVDRLVALLAAAMQQMLYNSTSALQAGGSLPLREVIAFPKSTGGNDLLVNAPSILDNSTLNQYHLQVLASSDKSNASHAASISKHA